MNAVLPRATAELRLWRAEGLRLPVWWRDDDATRPTPALDRLIALSASHAAPLHLAVIPLPATVELAQALQSRPLIRVLPHGWRHANHSPADQKKAEFGANRPVRDMLQEVGDGWRRIGDLFGTLALPLFTPPWNRVAPDLVAGLSGTGLKGVSTYGPRHAQQAAPDVLQVNTHLDPIAWHDGGGLIDPDRLDEAIAGTLRLRRTELADNSEPYGLLTHHLVQDEATWIFVETLFDLLSSSGVATWTGPLEGQTTRV